MPLSVLFREESTMTPDRGRKRDLIEREERMISRRAIGHELRVLADMRSMNVLQDVSPRSGAPQRSQSSRVTPSNERI